MPPSRDTKGRRAAPEAVTPAQEAALGHVREQAAARPVRVPGSEELVAAVRRHARVTLNFHPDRLLADGRSVAEALWDEGLYRSQFETGISNGSRTAFPGGTRDLWEERLFGGAYQRPGVGPEERPRYGALNLMHYPDGASPRFGSCHLRLRPEVLGRCTFLFGDSYAEPEVAGTIDAFEPVLAAVLASGWAPDMLAALLEPRPSAGPGRALDDYVEAQVHGEVWLRRDAEALVVDPSFLGTSTGRVLQALAEREGVQFEVHAGFELPAEEVPPEFRGPAIPPLARRVVRDFGSGAARIDAELIGRAAAAAVRTPEEWEPLDESLQHLKQLWHVLVRFGRAGSARR